jgi:hypothetical protein
MFHVEADYTVTVPGPDGTAVDVPIPAGDHEPTDPLEVAALEQLLAAGLATTNPPPRGKRGRATTDAQEG